MESESNTSAVQKFLEHLNIPKLLAGNAGEAISRLIGAGFDIPAAKLAQITQGIRDNTEARSIVRRAVAEKTGELAVRDPELLQRAKETFISDLVRKQENREAVAKNVIEQLGTVDSQDSGPVEDDWLNVFSSHVENASSERMRELWAKVLVGELRKPGEYSLSTLRFLSELSKDVAESFQLIAANSFLDFIPEMVSQNGVYFPHILALEESGLVTSGPGFGLQRKVSLKKNDPSLIVGKTMSIVLYPREDRDYNEQAIKYTKIGKDLLKLVDVNTSNEFIKLYVENLDKDKLEKIVVGKTIYVERNRYGINLDECQELWHI